MEQQQFRNLGRAMEPETISKNGASLKSQMSRRDKMKKVFVVILLFICSASLTFAQSDTSIANTIWYGYNTEHSIPSGLTIINFLSEKECEVVFIQEKDESAIFKYSYNIEEDFLYLTPPDGADYYPGLCYIVKKRKKIQGLKYCTLFPESENQRTLIIASADKKKLSVYWKNNPIFMTLNIKAPRRMEWRYAGKKDYVEFHKNLDNNFNPNFPRKR